MSSLNEIQIALQKMYDKHFSFLGFDKFLRDYGQSVLTAYYRVSTCATIDPVEILQIDGKPELKFLMKTRLIDALLCAQNEIGENIKRIEEIL